MNNKNDILDILEGAGVQLMPQEWYAANFRPPLDLSALEQAQAHYHNLRKIRDDLLPFREWMKVRQDGMTAQHYHDYTKYLDELLGELEKLFGIELLAAPQPISAQRDRPN